MLKFIAMLDSNANALVSSVETLDDKSDRHSIGTGRDKCEPRYEKTVLP
jgi:hypothetical protein